MPQPVIQQAFADSRRLLRHWDWIYILETSVFNFVHVIECDQYGSKWKWSLSQGLCQEELGLQTSDQSLQWPKMIWWEKRKRKIIFSTFQAFACQPWSIAGSNHGLAESRSSTMKGCLKYIGNEGPLVFVLENIKKFAGPQHMHVKNKLLKRPKQHRYIVQEATLKQPWLWKFPIKKKVVVCWIQKETCESGSVQV